MATQIKAKDRYAEMYDFVCIFQHDKDVFTKEGDNTTYSSLKDVVQSMDPKSIYALIRPGHPLYVSRAGKPGVINVISKGTGYTAEANTEIGYAGGSFATLDAVKNSIEDGQVIRVFESQTEYDDYYENEWTKDLAIQIKMAGKS